MQRTILGNRAMVDQRVAAEKKNGVGTPYIPPMARPLEMPDRSRAEPLHLLHKPVRRGREMIDLLAVEEPKPKPAKIRAVSYEAATRIMEGVSCLRAQVTNRRRT